MIETFYFYQLTNFYRLTVYHYIAHPYVRCIFSCGKNFYSCQWKVIRLQEVQWTTAPYFNMIRYVMYWFSLTVLTFWSRCLGLNRCGNRWSSGRGLGGRWSGCNWWGTSYCIGGSEAFSSPAGIRLETYHHTTATRQHRSRETVSTEMTYSNRDL